MTAMRFVIGTFLLALLAAPVVSCVVHTEGRVTTTRYHSWEYYPHYDVYYSPTMGVWAYWTGTRWVSVDRRPRWISPARYSVTISYRGTRPWRYWDHHRRHYYREDLPRRAPRVEPRRGPIDERGVRPDERRTRPSPDRRTRPSPDRRTQPERRPGPIDERGRPRSGGGDRERGGSRESGPRESGPRESGPRESGGGSFDERGSRQSTSSGQERAESSQRQARPQRQPRTDERGTRTRSEQANTRSSRQEQRNRQQERRSTSHTRSQNTSQRTQPSAEPRRFAEGPRQRARPRIGEREPLAEAQRHRQERQRQRERQAHHRGETSRTASTPTNRGRRIDERGR